MWRRGRRTGRNIFFFFVNIALDLGLQATQKILTSQDPLKTLRDISQNLPILAHSLSSQQVNKTLRKDVEQTIGQLEGIPDNVMWINKAALEAGQLDPFEYV